MMLNRKRKSLTGSTRSPVSISVWECRLSNKHWRMVKYLLSNISICYGCLVTNAASIIRLVNKVYEGTSKKSPAALKIRCPLKFNTMTAPFKQVWIWHNTGKLNKNFDHLSIFRWRIFSYFWKLPRPTEFRERVCFKPWICMKVEIWLRFSTHCYNLVPRSVSRCYSIWNSYS